MNIPKLPLQIAIVTGALMLLLGLAMLAVQRKSASNLLAPPEPAPPPRVVASSSPRILPSNDEKNRSDNPEAIREILDRMNSRALEEAPPIVYLAESEGTDDNRKASIAMNGKSMGRGLSAVELLATAYGTSRSRLRLANGVKLPAGRFDFLMTLDSGRNEALQEAIREKLQLTARPSVEQENVYILRALPGEFDNRRPSEDQGGGTRVSRTDGELTIRNASMGALVRSLEPLLPRPVIDESGLRGRFDISLSLEPLAHGDDDRPEAETVRKRVAEQLGLELQPEKRELEVMLVEAVSKG